MRTETQDLMERLEALARYEHDDHSICDEAAEALRTLQERARLAERDGEDLALAVLYCGDSSHWTTELRRLLPEPVAERVLTTQRERSERLRLAEQP